ncbi:MAG: cytochrome P450 [Actinomycetota bacterium]
MAYGTDEDVHGRVEDWATDWDWLDDRWGEEAPTIYRELRESGCPIAFTERYGRAWMPVTHDDVAHIAADTTHFSSFRVAVGQPGAPIRPAPPITSDPPEHQGHRRLLLPAFSPRKIAALEAPTRDYCRSLIARLDGLDRADAAEQYSQDIPVHVIAEMIGVPEEDADVFRDWIHLNFQVAPKDNEVRLRVRHEMQDYFGQLVEQRLDDPCDDLATLVSTAEIDGQPVDREHQTGYLALLILAGIDTTWSGIGSGLWHFAQHPDERRRLAATPHDDPLWLMAVEEVLRYYSPVTMARQVIADTEVGGCPMHAGDQVLLTFPAANRDPAVFERADDFVVDRAANRHSAFGLGIHRCVGSNLARMEMLVAFQEWIAAFPDYELDPSGHTTWANGQIRGPRSIPVLLRA